MLSILTALALAGAPASPPPSAAEGTRSVTVTATDESGAPVEGLGPEEVAVLEDGNVREVTRFERDRRPLDVAILVDSSEPVATSYRLSFIDAVAQLVNRLPEGARYAIWTTGDRPKKIVDYGAGPIEARKALSRVFPSGGNTLFDALVEASQDLKQKEGSRAVIVVVTGLGIGFTNYSRQHVVDELKDGPPVLALEVDETRATRGDEGQGEVSTQDYDFVLSSLASATGGRRERVLSAMAADKGLQEFAADLKGQYRLSYRTEPGPKDRKIEVKVARPGVKVRVGSPRS